MSQLFPRTALGDADLPKRKASTAATNVSSAPERSEVQVYCVDSYQVLTLHLGAFDGPQKGVKRTNAGIYRNEIIVLHVNSLCWQVPALLFMYLDATRESFSPSLFLWLL